MLAIWQYVPGLSLTFPIVKKNRLNNEKTSLSTISTRFDSLGGAISLVDNSATEGVNPSSSSSSSCLAKSSASLAPFAAEGVRCGEGEGEVERNGGRGVIIFIVEKSSDGGVRCSTDTDNGCL